MAGSEVLLGLASIAFARKADDIFGVNTNIALLAESDNDGEVCPSFQREVAENPIPNHATNSYDSKQIPITLTRKLLSVPELREQLQIARTKQRGLLDHNRSKVQNDTQMAQNDHQRVQSDRQRVQSDSIENDDLATKVLPILGVPVKCAVTSNLSEMERIFPNGIWHHVSHVGTDCGGCCVPSTDTTDILVKAAALCRLYDHHVIGKDVMTSLMFELELITSERLEQILQRDETYRTEYPRLYELYMKDRSNVLSEALSTSSCDADGKSGEYSRRRLLKCLEGLADVERRGAQRAIESRLLEGIRKDVLDDVVNAVDDNSTRLRLGLPGVLKLLESKGISTAVISASWSKELLQRLLPSGKSGNAGTPIYSNSLSFDDTGRASGNLEIHISSAADKLKVFNQFSSSLPATVVKPDSPAASRAKSSMAKRVFIGDGATDLLCLLEADIGILLKEPGRTFKKICSTFGIQIKPIEAAAESLAGQLQSCQDSKKVTQPAVYLASSWDEVGLLLFGRKYRD